MNNGKQADLYIGCPIWSYKGWVNTFFPKGTQPSEYLRVYAQQLTTVEGNTTFYAVPSQATVQRWVEETPETFRFCPKMPRAISHSGTLMEHFDEAMQFLAVMSQLGSRLGPIFLQLPPHYSPSMMADLRTFLTRWPAEAQLAVEVRHLAWFEDINHDSLQTLLASLSMARVIIDTRPIRVLAGDTILQNTVYERLLQARERKPNLPVALEPTAPFTFLRYIGHPQIEQNLPFLDEWAAYLAGWLAEGRNAYVFCHCPDERLDPTLCRELHRRVADRAPVSPLPQLNTGAESKQARLF